MLNLVGEDLDIDNDPYPCSPTYERMHHVFISRRISHPMLAYRGVVDRQPHGRYLLYRFSTV